MKKLLTIVLATFAIYTKAQIISSPESQHMVQDVNVPVNLYNGVASVQVPLYTVEANNGAKVPIYLLYTTQGIKVNDVSGPVGLGWNLYGGGAITRVIRHNDDLTANYTTSINESNIRGAMVDDDETIDFEKDLFFFNFPGGSGKFIKTGTNEFKTLPSSDLSISFSSNSFTITDTQGTKYYFGTSDASREKSTSVTGMNVDEGIGFTAFGDKQYTGTWLLTKIEFVNQPTTKGIEYTYDELPGSEFTGFLTQMESFTSASRLNGPSPNYSLHGDVNTYESLSSNFTKYLTSITFPKGSVSFKYENDRQDFKRGRRLDQISINDHNGTIVNEIRFDQSYFDSSDSYFKETNSVANPNEYFYRLKLDAVYINDIQVRSFDYRNDKDFTGGYDNYELPPRHCYYYDHWGYNNANAAMGSTYVRHASSTSPGLSGMDREPNEYSQANILTKVTYPTGGFTEFAYGYNSENGGVRIERVTVKNPDNTKVSDIQYTYSIPSARELIQYISKQGVGDDGIGDRNSVTKEYTNDDNLHPFANSHALSLHLDLNGSLGGYGQVRVEDMMTGLYSINYYKTATNYPASPSYKYCYMIESGNGQVYDDYYTSNYDNKPPFTAHTLNSFRRGELYRTENYGTDNVKTSQVSYSYSEVSDGLPITNNSVNFWAYDDDNSETDPDDDVFWYLIGRYQIYPKYYRLDNTVSIEYEGGIRKREIQTNYTYISSYKTIAREIESVQNFPTTLKYNSKKTFYYPFDTSIPPIDTEYSYGERLILASLSTSWVKSVPVLVLDQINLPSYSSGTYKYSGISLTTYSEQESFDLPYQTFSLRETSEPLSSWSKSDLTLTNTYTYGANGLISTVRDELAQVETDYTYDVNGYLITESIDAGYGTNQRSTSYTYEPLIGVSTVTPTDGRSTSYEYDNKNQLAVVRDHNNNIINKYRSYTVSESDDLSSEIEVESCLYRNRAINFDAFGWRGFYGNTTYEWDFGDGNTYTSTTNGEASNTYTSNGTYTVTLSIRNREYSMINEVTKQITIDSAPNSICGPYMYDVSSNTESGNSCNNNNGNPEITFELNDADASVKNEWRYQIQQTSGGSWTEWYSFGENSLKATLKEEYFATTAFNVPYAIKVECYLTECGDKIYKTVNIQL
ncbi:RHS repeat domain-containing protein [Ekhidna sp.]|uniref:RHS repeat domain-containing protein n=1 Tax=Ekhidna sp. TaxID=2608089 RepID=UPI003B5116DA